jgi:hypothetical protein
MHVQASIFCDIILLQNLFAVNYDSVMFYSVDPWRCIRNIFFFVTYEYGQ